MHDSTSTDEFTDSPRRRAVDGQTRRRQASRQRLLDASRELFVARGYDATRPQDVARRAGVATGTFYLHFSGKQDAFLAFAESVQSELSARYASKLAGVTGTRARLEAVLETMLHYAAEHPGVLQAAFLDPVMIAPHDDDAWRLYDRISTFTRDGLGLPSTEEGALLSQGLCGFLRHALIYAGRRTLEFPKVVSTLASFIESGLAARHGLSGTDDPLHSHTTDQGEST